MVYKVDCVVVGAGVVGLACARVLAMTGREVLIVDRAEAIGTGISSRNSEVIHAGLYYPPGSLKAELCIAGRDMLYAYCETHRIAYRQTGKLIVATTGAERAPLLRILENARACGTTRLEWLEGPPLARREPALSAEAALWSPLTGIVDSHALMLALLGDAESHGAILALRTEVATIDAPSGGLQVTTRGPDAMTLGADIVVNSAGIDAPHLARTMTALDKAFIPSPRYCKGSYFTLRGRSPFNHLIYPVPQEAGLGIHLTMDLAGQAKFGPDSEWVDSLDYSIDEAAAPHFEAAIRRYWPGLPDGSLQPDYAGIRPKISGPGEPAADFRIDGAAVHGVAGLINLFGIESPGLTASLAIAQRVAALAGSSCAQSG